MLFHAFTSMRRSRATDVAMGAFCTRYWWSKTSLRKALPSHRHAAEPNAIGSRIGSGAVSPVRYTDTANVQPSRLMNLIMVGPFIMTGVGHTKNFTRSTTGVKCLAKNTGSPNNKADN